MSKLETELDYERKIDRLQTALHKHHISISSKLNIWPPNAAEKANCPICGIALKAGTQG